MIGSTISHYRIVSELGRGGMGIVYKAEDTRLKRTVAVKVLPRQGLGDGDELSRFAREAQAAAALNHPHIATVYEIDKAVPRTAAEIPGVSAEETDEEDGQSFIVMEYVDGPSLKDKIEEGPQKLDEAVRIAIQIASGLEAAHEQGIVHRDIKPANVMLTKKGESKIMDFGLAKLSDQTTLTKTGTTLGTVAYMSPEQALGEMVDHRSDIFALGVVIYEMLTGQSAFKGAYAEAIVYSILNVDPEPITALRTGVPMELERIVGKCLAKTPNERYQGMSDVLVDLRALSKTRLHSGSGLVQATAIESTPGQPNRRTLLPWAVAAGTLVVALLALWRPWADNEPSEKEVRRYAISLPQDQTLAGRGSAVALSDDGTKLVYVAKTAGESRLYLKKSNKFDAEPIPGTKGASAPFFSPDGEWVGFFADETLKKVSLEGGNPQNICDAEGLGATWSTDGTIVFSDYVQVGLWRVSEDGGSPEAITRWGEDFERGAFYHSWPEMLPGDKAILYTSWNGREQMSIAVIEPETGKQQTLIELGGFARFVPPGHLVYALGDDLLAVQFDPVNWRIDGSPFPVLEGVTRDFYGTAHYSISKSGSLSYIAGGGSRTQGRTLIWVDRQGVEESIPLPTGVYDAVRISPDGRKVVLMEFTRIWIGDLARGTMQPITDDQGSDFWPIWTVDGGRIVFNSDRSGTAGNLHWMRSDGGGVIDRLIEGNSNHQAQSWTPDGKTLAFTDMEDPASGLDIMTLSFDGERRVKPLIKTKYLEYHPSFSPDGHLLAFVSDRSGGKEVYVQTYPEADRVTRISTEGGQEPVWSPDGSELFYRDESGNRLMVVRFPSDPAIAPGLPELVFEGEYHEGHVWGRNYDISRDGERFLMIKQRDPLLTARQINIVLNWTEELKRRNQEGE